MMRRSFIVGPLTVALLVSLTPAAAHAAAAPTAKQLKRALITKWKGKKADLVRSGTGRSVVAGQDDWALSLVPARCRTAATAGLLFNGHLRGRPAAMSMLSVGGSFYGQVLVSGRRPPGCPRRPCRRAAAGSRPSTTAGASPYGSAR
ncbi:hypothetical protein AB0J42_23100 [Nonomuraea sp. NPDC049649]|uniref:hypothetical protein n=1 Tax=Nonomuraea sp. NPDC049649 TaxID=3155776 RepID=UPI00343082F8